MGKSSNATGKDDNRASSFRQLPHKSVDPSCRIPRSVRIAQVNVVRYPRCWRRRRPPGNLAIQVYGPTVVSAQTRVRANPWQSCWPDLRYLQINQGKSLGAPIYVATAPKLSGNCGRAPLPSVT